jgi:hypothetical protein
MTMSLPQVIGVVGERNEFAIVPLDREIIPHPNVSRSCQFPDFDLALFEGCSEVAQELTVPSSELVGDQDHGGLTSRILHDTSLTDRGDDMWSGGGVSGKADLPG